MFTERKPEYNDILYLSGHLRKEDVRELYLRGLTPETALKKSFTMSEYCFTVCLNNKPIAMFGAGRKEFSSGERRASIWFLGSKDIEICKPEFLKKSKRYMEFFKSKFDILENYIDVNNTKYIKWLKWLGFKFDEPFNIPYGQLVHFSIKKCKLRHLPY